MNASPDSQSLNSQMTARLSIMMFLQFFTWGAWFATLGAALTESRLTAFVGGAYSAAPLAAIFAPLFLGLIADRWFSSQRIFGCLMLLGGVLMFMVPMYGNSASEYANDLFRKMQTQSKPVEPSAAQQAQPDQSPANGEVPGNDSPTEPDATQPLTENGVAPENSGTQSTVAFASQDDLIKAFNERQLSENQSGNTMVWLILAYMLCYMPTLGLGNTIAFTHIPSQEKFPLIRVWGTIGWIIAGLVIGGMGWYKTFTIFQLAAISSLVLGVYCFTLPNTPPPLKGKPIDLRSLFMVDALKLLKDWNFAIFALCSMLVSIPLAFYYGSTSQFLTQTGFKAAAATMTLGQMFEIVFMLMIPFFFRHLGVKNMILIGIACWVFRYLLFSFGAPDQVTWMLLLAVALHGICYDFFFVTGFMYTDKKAPKEIRGQAQAFLVFLTQGIGMYFGYMIMGKEKLFGLFTLDLRIGPFGEEVTKSEALQKSIAAATPTTPPGEGLNYFVETFGRMFERKLPWGVDDAILSTAMQQWHSFWMVPAILAAVVFVLFFLLFWDRGIQPVETEKP
jgi:MFS family permease